MSGPLAGIRILDLTTVQMGPWCTRIVADYGADVIKVEAPEGDSSRYTGVPRHRGMSGTFQHNARGKRSIALDLKQQAAKDAILRLVPGADAFVSNIRPGALGRLGLDYESVKKLNPSIVYLGMVGYGSGGRYAGRPAYDDLIQAASGIPMLLQRSTGEPRYIPMAAIDRIVGGAAANALLAGLLARARTGIGQSIEVPMFETMAQFVLSEHMQGTTFDPPTSPPGYPRTLSRQRRPYATKDGFLAVLPYNDGQWRRFFEVAGKWHTLESDPRFADIGARTANIDSLYEMVGEELQHRTTDAALHRPRAQQRDQHLGVDAHQVAAAPAVDVDQRQLEHGGFDIHRHRLARAKGRGAAQLVAAVALGHLGLAVVDLLRVDLAREVLGADLHVAVHQHDERLRGVVFHHQRLDDLVLVDRQLARRLGRAAVVDVVIDVF